MDTNDHSLHVFTSMCWTVAIKISIKAVLPTLQKILIVIFIEKNISYIYTNNILKNSFHIIMTVLRCIER